MQDASFITKDASFKTYHASFKTYHASCILLNASGIMHDPHRLVNNRKSSNFIVTFWIMHHTLLNMNHTNSIMQKSSHIMHHTEWTTERLKYRNFLNKDLAKSGKSWGWPIIQKKLFWICPQLPTGATWFFGRSIYFRKRN